MSLRLNGSTSGYTEIDAPAVAGSNTLVLPTGNGSDGNILGTDGAGNLSWVGGRMVLETAKASTSGTSIDFTGIPSWVKKITVMFSGVSTSGTSGRALQIGDSGGIETSGYTGGAFLSGAAGGFAISTSNFPLSIGSNNTATETMHGQVIISNLTGNTWVISGAIHTPTYGVGNSVGGSKTLSDTLTQVRITTVNGTDTFDAGSINLLLEG
jgi:hypothetical protein